MINHPLYKPVQKIVASKVVNGVIKQSEFKNIRNQQSVRAILNDMGYAPNCEVRPFTWKFAPKPVAVKSKLVAAPKKRKVAPPQKRGTARKWLLKQLQAGELIYLADMGVTNKYALDLILNLRKGGWPIELLRREPDGKGQPKIIGCRLIEQ